jgi:nucleoside-triphosphatase
MTDSPSNILVTGPPGVGKTTLIMKLADKLSDRRTAGFYTSEIREGRIRKGFELLSLDGRRGILSHVDIKSPHRVSKYGVDIPAFEQFLDSLNLDHADCVIIDEIGKMETFSRKFRELMTSVLDSRQLVIATIAQKGVGFIAHVKSRPDIVVYSITTRTRDSLVDQIVKKL